MTPVGAVLAARFPQRFPQWHRWVYEATRGWIGHRWTGFPCLLLTTTGRRSRVPRKTVLTYVDMDGTPIVAASNGGSDHPPAWYLNLTADPAVTVRVGRRQWSTFAEQIEPSTEEFEHAWRALNRLRDGRYDEYQRLAERPIPLMRFPAEHNSTSRPHSESDA